MKSKLFTLMLVSTVAVLTGCGSSDTQPGLSNSSSSSPTASEVAISELGDTEFTTAAELKDAFIRAGYVCADWKEDNLVGLASSSGHCDNTDVFSVYASETARDELIQRNKNLTTSNGGHLVVGKNWIVNTGDAKMWAKQTGAMPVVWGAASN